MCLQVSKQPRSQSDRHLAGEYVRVNICLLSSSIMSENTRDYRFFRSFSVKVDNWPMRKAEYLWHRLRKHRLAGLSKWITDFQFILYFGL